MTYSVHRRDADIRHGVLPATLSEVLSQSDFVSMHAPARPEFTTC